MNSPFFFGRLDTVESVHLDVVSDVWGYLKIGARTRDVAGYPHWVSPTHAMGIQNGSNQRCEQPIPVEAHERVLLEGEPEGSEGAARKVDPPEFRPSMRSRWSERLFVVATLQAPASWHMSNENRLLFIQLLQFMLR